MIKVIGMPTYKDIIFATYQRLHYTPNNLCTYKGTEELVHFSVIKVLKK